jgi:hypothetical protein
MKEYSKLDLGKTIETIDRLIFRIDERFPESGLVKVCRQLHQIANGSSQTISYISKPVYWIRIAVSFFVTLILFLLYILITNNIRLDTLKVAEGNSLGELVQAIESGTNDIIFIVLGIYFLFRYENILKRRKALKDLNQLRAIAHVIDMHQLTKDSDSMNLQGTEHSPVRNLDGFLLTRYLTYCSEMLSLTSKVSALYANDFDDEVVLNAINEIEELTTGLCNKIWQKIVIIKNEL